MSGITYGDFLAQKQAPLTELFKPHRLGGSSSSGDAYDYHYSVGSWTCSYCRDGTYSYYDRDYESGWGADYTRMVGIYFVFPCIEDVPSHFLEAAYHDLSSQKGKPSTPVLVCQYVSIDRDHIDPHEEFSLANIRTSISMISPDGFIQEVHGGKVTPNTDVAATQGYVYTYVPPPPKPVVTTPAVATTTSARPAPKARHGRFTGPKGREGGDTCHRCGKVGHYARDCPKPKCCNKCGSAAHLSFNCPLKK